MLILAGPPGAGKSTIAKAMEADGREVFLERPDDNPYLLGLLAGDASLGYQCQEWFVDAIETFLLRLSPDQRVVVDQDPAATALIYGRALHLRGLLTDDETQRLARRLEAVENLLNRWPRCDAVLLDAPVDVLEARLRKRAAGRPETFWLAELRERFLDLAPIAKYVYLGTVEQDADGIVESILGISGESGLAVRTGS